MDVTAEVLAIFDDLFMEDVSDMILSHDMFHILSYNSDDT